MRKNIFVPLFLVLLVITGCVDNELQQSPNDDHYPFRLILDADEGGSLPDEEDYSLEVKFADYIGSLPAQSITVDYQIFDLEDDMRGEVKIDKIIYEVEKNDCTFERELPFSSSGDNLTGTITIAPDADLGTVPESFEIVFTLPGKDDTEGKFSFRLSNLKAPGNTILGTPLEFEYETLDNDVAGEWELEIKSKEQFEQFKLVFAPLNHELEALAFDDITGTITAEFGFEEMTFTIELEEEEEVTVCENGDTETEIENKELEIEAEYEAEDSELILEGSHLIIGKDGEVEDELDFMVESEYHVDEEDEEIEITFFAVIDEDNFAKGKELFSHTNGISFTFKKD